MEYAKETMVRILIVDDEKAHRKGLMNLLQELYPQSILLEAADGTDALAVMEYIDCDIMIADIQMVNMDGLTLLKKAKERKPEIEVVILSGYGQFEYAREAIRQKAADYLMKPVDKKEMEQVLTKIMEKLQASREKLIRKQQVEDSLTRTMPVYVEHLMNLLIQKEEFPLKQQLEALFPLKQPGYFFLCCLEEKREGYGEDERQKMKYMMKKCLDPHSSYSFFWEMRPEVLAACVIADFMPDIPYFETIQHCMEKEYGRKCAIYLGRHVENLDQGAVTSFQQAEHLWQYHFYLTEGVISLKQAQFQTEKLKGEPEFDLPAITKRLKNKETAAIYELVEAALEESIRYHYPAPVLLKQKTAFLLFQIIRTCELMVSEDFKGTMNQLVDELLKVDTFSRLKIKIKQFLFRLDGEMKRYQEQADITGRDMLFHCKEFLDNHYMEEISLEQIAEKYYFNPSYFSSLFKNTFDMTFSEYLIRLRMGKAKQFLLETGDKVKEVSAKVGYRDANYFVRSFKKYYGVTPEEFRRQAIRQED